jgi:thioredoxin-dependent peroxiredoxin
MTNTFTRFLLAAWFFLSGSAFAALPVGAPAPDFKLPASLAGKPLEFSLSEALKRGPVVLYFYPAAFTPGCTREAHDFAEATAQFAALGATVLGVSTDDLETLHKFSVSECRNKFAVAADVSGQVTQAYEAAVTELKEKPRYAERISYVITPQATIAYVYSDSDPSDHVPNTLAAVKKWRDQKL